MEKLIIRIVAVATMLACPWLLSGSAGAASYLNTVQSEVFQTTGTHQEIAKRAITCVTQHIRPGVISAPTITSSDPDAGIIVANNGFYYSSGGFLSVRYTARSTLTFEAKDGRFRITHTNIESFNEMRGADQAWGPIGLWQFGGGDDARAALNAISATLANCVQQVSKPADNW